MVAFLQGLRTGEAGSGCPYGRTGANPGRRAAQPVIRQRQRQWAARR